MNPVFRGATMPKRLILPVSNLENTPPWDTVLKSGTREVLERQKRFRDLGIIDEEGRRLNKELPPDMRSGSETSV
jgi:hypothetical protein